MIFDQFSWWELKLVQDPIGILGGVWKYLLQMSNLTFIMHSFGYEDSFQLFFVRNPDL